MSKKLTYSFVKEQFEKEGYTLLSKEYINSSSKLEYRCPEGHEHSISWNKWQNNRRCPVCGNLNKAKKFRMDFNIIKESFKKENYMLLTNSDEYKNCDQRLKYICSKYHKHSISWSNWRNGKRCPYCRHEESKLNINIIKESFKNEGYSPLFTNYKNSRTKLYYICPKGHKHYITWNKWQQGRRCPHCFSKTSRWENTIKSFIDYLNIDYTSNDRTKIINPNTKCFLELDIWMPQLNKAIECNGIFWHDSEWSKERDLLKQYLCKEKGIDLLVVTGKEWYNDIDVCKQKIKEFIGGV